MKSLKYTIYGGRAYPTELKSAHAGTLKYEFSDVASGTLRLADTLYPLSYGKCEVKLSGIKDGDYTPELITENIHVKLDKITVYAGTVSLACPEENLTRLATELVSLAKRQDAADEAISQLRNAVFGKKIF